MRTIEERNSMRKSFTYEGKRYYVTAKSEKELNEKVARKKKELSSPKMLTLGEWFDEWIEIYKSDASDRTVKSYLQRRKHYEKILNKKLDKITHLDLQKIFNSLKGYADNTIKKVYHDLDQLFKYAVINKYITENPLSGVLLPSGGKDTRRALTDQERGRLLRILPTLSYGLYFYLMLYCGLRPHECAVIQGKDVQGSKLHVRGTKSRAADRYVPLNEFMEEKLSGFADDEYVCKSISGISPITEAHRAKMWKAIRGAFDEDVTPYCLRHTYCTDLQDAGIPINVARQFMGHSSINLTATIYTHHTEESFNDALNKIRCHTKCHT